MEKFWGAVRYALALLILAGSAPNYFILWFAWRVVSIVLPEWIYQLGDDCLYSMYQRMVVFFFEHCTNQKIYITGDQVFDRKENVLYVGNHQSTVDWVICNMIAIRQGSIGHLRYVMKDTLQMLPLYGHYFYQHGCIYVKRGNFKQKKMENALEYLRDPNIKSWTIIFPEGTCYDPAEYDLIKKSEKAAGESGLKPLVHHLTPRYRGSFLALEKLRSNLDAIYDVTCVYSGSINEKNERLPAPQLVDFLVGKNKELHIHVKRIPIEDVPQDEASFKTWMHDLFIAKDEIVSNFYREGHLINKGLDMKTLGKSNPLSLLETVPSLLFFIATFLPIVFVPQLRFMWLQSIVLSTILGYSWLAIKSVC